LVYFVVLTPTTMSLFVICRPGPAGHDVPVLTGMVPRSVQACNPTCTDAQRTCTSAGSDPRYAHRNRTPPVCIPRVRVLCTMYYCRAAYGEFHECFESPPHIETHGEVSDLMRGPLLPSRWLRFTVRLLARCSTVTLLCSQSQWQCVSTVRRSVAAQRRLCASLSEHSSIPLL
jgi:hypothetical protein